MESKRIMAVLAVILLAACLIVSITLVRVRYVTDYVPSEAIDDLVEIMARDGVMIDRDLISDTRMSGTVYMFDSDDYTRTVAELLGGSSVRDCFVIPNGELIVLENGSRCEFGRNFTFRYCESATEETFSPSIVELRSYARAREAVEDDPSVEAVRTFLDNGSRSFGERGELDVDVTIDELWEYDGVEYVLCSRTIDGVAITGNLVLCTVEGERVTSAYGTWCFFTTGSSYSAQLADVLNILFNVKKDLSTHAPSQSSSKEAAESEEYVTIEAIRSCYSLYFFGEEENFCLIPCWQITTDTRGELIYNAINGTLYTKTSE